MSPKQKDLRNLLLASVAAIGVMAAAPANAQVLTSSVSDADADTNTANTLYDSDGTGGIIATTMGAFTSGIDMDASGVSLRVEDSVSTAGDAIIVTQAGSAGITITSGDTVTSTGASGIVAQSGSALATISVAGTITATTSGEYAIDVRNASGVTAISLNSDSGDINGTVALGASDTFAVTGDGTSTLTTLALNGTTGASQSATFTLTGSSDDITIDDITDIETVTIAEGVVTVDDVSGASTAFNVESGGTLTTGATSNIASALTIASGGSLVANASAEHTANVTFTDGSGSVTGTLVFGSGDQTFSYTGSAGADTVAANFTGGAGSGDTFTATDAAGGGASFSGTIGTFETINVNGGTVTFDGSVSGVTQVEVADGAAMVITGSTFGATDIDLGASSSLTINDAAVDYAGTITDNGSTANALTLTDGTISGAVTLGAGIDTVTVTAGTFSGALSTGDAVDVIDINGGTISGGINTGAGADTVTIAGATVTGYDGGADADTVTIDGTSTVGGTVANVTAFAVATGGAFTLTSTSTTTADVTGTAGANTYTQRAGTIDDVDFSAAGDDSLTLNGTAATTAITMDDVTFGATGSSTDTIDFTQGAVTIGTISGTDVAADLTAGSNSATLTFADYAGTTTADAEIASMTVDTNSNLYFTVAGSAATTAGYTNIDLNGAGDSVTAATDGDVFLSFSGNTANFLADGQTLTLIDDVSESTNLSGDFVLNTTSHGLFVTLAEDTTVADGTYEVEVTINANDDFTASNITQNATNTTAITNAILGSGYDTDSLGTIRGSLLNSSTSTAQIAANLVDDLGPGTENLGFLQGGLNVDRKTDEIVASRTADLRQGTGSAAGDVAARGRRLWVQAFGSTAEQGTTDKIFGYDADTMGVAVGADSERILPNTVVGIAASYGKTEVDSANANRTNQEIDTYQVGLYAEHVRPVSKIFVNGQLSAGLNTVDQSRYDVGGAGTTASSDYDAMQYNARLEVGKDFAANKSGSFIITPSAVANYSLVTTDSYSESGAGVLNLTNVAIDDISTLTLGANLRLANEIKRPSGAVLTPSVNFGYAYDMLDDKIDTFATFQGGGSAFRTQSADPEQSSYTAGAGLKYAGTGKWEFSANYDYMGKEDYDAHGGRLRATYKF